MSMISCPECGTGVSSRARVCPYCGFSAEDGAIPIGELPARELTTKRIRYDVVRTKDDGQIHETMELSSNDSRRMMRFLREWKYARMLIPGIVQFLQEAFGKGDMRMVAKLPEYYRRLLDEGRIHFQADTNGEILSSLFDDRGRIVKQVRLEQCADIPDLLPVLQHLQTQAALASVLAEVKSVGESVTALRVEQQNDRLAMVDGAWDKFMQACRISDSRLRDQALLQSAAAATDAKRVLMRNFETNLRIIKDHEKRTRKADVAANAVDALAAIARAVRVEGRSYIELEQFDAGREVLAQFRRFVIDNKLNDEDTLILVNEHLSRDRKMESAKVLSHINEFVRKVTDNAMGNAIEQERNGEAKAIAASSSTVQGNSIEGENVQE